MAIPFNLPTDEQTEDNYRRLDQLLLDLYHVLRQILLRPRSDASNREEDGGGGGAVAPSASRPVADVRGPNRHRLDPGLPDVVSSTLDCHCQGSRRRQRRCRRRRTCNCCQAQTDDDSRQPGHRRRNSSTSTCVSQVSRTSCIPAPSQSPRREDSWLVLGEHLRKIAEEFKTSLKKDDYPKEEDHKLKMEVKTSGLFSLLVPSHFRNSLWTTVILLVGWRLLVQARAR